MTCQIASAEAPRSVSDRFHFCMSGGITVRHDAAWRLADDLQVRRIYDHSAITAIALGLGQVAHRERALDELLLSWFCRLNDFAGVCCPGAPRQHQCSGTNRTASTTNQGAPGQ